MTVIYMQGQSPFHPDPMVQEMDDMAEYAAAARQQAYGQPHTPAEAVTHLCYDDEYEGDPLGAAKGILVALAIVGGCIASVGIIALAAGL